MATLFIVATPIGNLQDLSQRAVETLHNCPIIACEDTRTSRHLLEKFNIKAELIAYHDNNEIACTAVLIEKLHQGQNVAVVCDAGTPTISDPGFRIVRECQKQNILIVPIPGPNAAITALSASGLPSNQFLFLGFPGHKSSARIHLLEIYKNFPATLIFYESCHRIEKFLREIFDTLGSERVITLCKELTKLHEFIKTDTIGNFCAQFDKITPKGEFVVLIAPSNFSL